MTILLGLPQTVPVYACCPGTIVKSPPPDPFTLINYPVWTINYISLTEDPHPVTSKGRVPSGSRAPDTLPRLTFHRRRLRRWNSFFLLLPVIPRFPACAQIIVGRGDGGLVRVMFFRTVLYPLLNHSTNHLQAQRIPQSASIHIPGPERF